MDNMDGYSRNTKAFYLDINDRICEFFSEWYDSIVNDFDMSYHTAEEKRAFWSDIQNLDKLRKAVFSALIQCAEKTAVRKDFDFMSCLKECLESPIESWTECVTDIKSFRDQ